MGNNPIGEAAAEEIVAVRENWHTKNHPFFVEFSEGKFGLPALGALMAQHYQHVDRVQHSLGIAVYKARGLARQFMIENLAEEEGLLTGEGEGRVPINHMELIYRFCEVAGISKENVFKTEQLPAWRARSYYYMNVVREESIGVIVAMQSTQEGQQPAINIERVIPAMEKFHGYTMESPEIEFFTEHAIADTEHSGRQIELVKELIRTEDVKARAIEIAEIAVKTRWACMNDIYRVAVKGEIDPLPANVQAA
ncbi:iron-containing redox enzyme family protein [Alphaproteobacteria bacterium]|nr:iron-containing redox enzyme family protein [Alphaproteobacteria bacterium]